MSDGGTQALRRAATVRRTDALFQAMSTDYLLREQFVTGPVEVLSEFVYGEPVSPEDAAAANRLIYSVVANPELRSWLHGYAARRTGAVPSGEEFLDEFSHAVATLGGKDVVSALIRASAPDQGVALHDADLLHFIFKLGQAARLNEAETNNLTGTGAGADVAADAGTLTGVTWSTLLTGTGTGTRPTTDPFTRSPFTGTGPPVAAFDMVGERFGQFGPDYVMVTLDALTQYATRLRESGALGGQR